MGDNARLHDHEKLIAADEINNIKHLRMKMQYGQENTAIDVSSDNPLPVSGNVTLSGGTITQITAPAATDAFGKLRVSQPTTLGDYYHVSGENPEMLLKVSGSGSGTSNVSTSSYILSVGTGSGDYAVHQSKMYHHYLPGKSQLIQESFCLGEARANTVKRVGYFDDRNGVFFQQAGDGTLSFVFRTYITGTPVDTVVPQSQWNIDTCNASIAGTGILPDNSNASNYGQVGSWTLDPVPSPPPRRRMTPDELEAAWKDSATADPRTGVTDAIRAAASVNNPRSRLTPDELEAAWKDSATADPGTGVTDAIRAAASVNNPRSRRTPDELEALWKQSRREEK